LATRLAHAGAIQHSESFRLQTWHGTARMIAARPLTGFGGGAYEFAYPRYAEVGFTRAAHNIYLQFGAEQGLPGLLLFVAVLATVLWTPPVPRAEASLVLGMKAALVGVAVHGLVDYGWQIPALAVLTAGLVGGIAAVPKRTQRTAGARRLASAVPTVLVMAVTVGFVVPEWLADRQATRAMEAAAQGSLNVAAERYVQAVRWSPRNESIRLEYAAVLEGLARRSDFGSQDALQEAERQYRRAVCLAPTHASALRRLGEFYFRQDRFTDAVRYLKRAVAAFPNYTAAYYALGEAHRALHHPQEAERAYQRVLDIADGPAGQLQAVPELAFDVAIARAAL